jgi:hypothetical protein
MSTPIANPLRSMVVQSSLHSARAWLLSLPRTVSRTRAEGSTMLAGLFGLRS